VSKIQSRGRRYQQKAQQQQNRVNRQIRAKEVLLITAGNDKLGPMPVYEALDRAQAEGLDLVEVSPNADPPVCKIMDYGKFQYEKSKQAKDAKKKQTKVVLKEIKFKSVRTADHDFQFRMRHAREFLSNGWKVKASIRFSGREMLHIDLGTEMLRRFAEEVADIAEIELPPRMESRSMFMILTPTAR
jgi:translation initiation factor IF-3